MLARVSSARRLEGEVSVPGDKSISHRALILNAIADGEAQIENLSTGADVASTASCLGQLGVDIIDGRVRGVGLRGLRPAGAPLDCANSGTTMRLLAGLLAGQDFQSVLTGDGSLSRRPMERVAAPLRQMGARADAGPPLRVGGRVPLHGIEYASPVASAQVKSALLLAGLYAEDETVVIEPAASRDHTELMLAAMGAPVSAAPGRAAVHGVERLDALHVRVPGDLSAAAFWLVAANAHARARVVVRDVGVNPTRGAILSYLRVTRGRERTEGLEPVADLVATSARDATALSIDGEQAALVIDELPVLAVLAATLPGLSRITGARELRVKESDRIAAMAEGLRAMGARMKELEDGWEIEGGRLQGARVRSHGDHRVAMALAVAGLVAEGETEIEDAECVAISYPGFWDDLEKLCR